MIALYYSITGRDFRHIKGVVLGKKGGSSEPNELSLDPPLSDKWPLVGRALRVQSLALSTLSSCGSKIHDGRRKNCPAYKRAYRKCGKIGHYSEV